MEGAESPLAPTEAASEDTPALPPDVAEMGCFVISVSEKRKIRRLHRVGSCWMRPGVDYRNFEILGMDPPRAAQYVSGMRIGE